MTSAAATSFDAISRRTGLTSRRYFVHLAIAAACLLALLLISPGVGTESGTVGLWDAWRAQLGIAIDAGELVGNPLADADADGVITAEEYETFVVLAKTIGFGQRFSRSLLALQVGITLALCGAAFQILFRNALATPFTLGIASGGSLGALVAFRLGLVGLIAGIPILSIGAFGGAISVVALVFLIAHGARRLTSNELLLAGFTLGLFCSAMMMFITAISNERETFFVVRWMMGSLDPIRATEGVLLLPMLLPAWVVLILFARSFNQYRLGDELAAARGVNIAWLQGVSVLVCTLAVAGVVAYCGPIGFVGLIVPHIVSLLVGPDCRILLPTSALAGGAFLILCDWVSQLSMRLAGWATGRHLGSATLPIGVVTAIVGVPIFVILLRARRGRLS